MSILEGILTNLASEIIIRASDFSANKIMGRVLGASDEFRLRQTVQEALRRLGEDYRDLEEREGAAYVLNQEFFEDDVVHAELLKIFRPESFSRERLIQRYVEIYRSDNLDIFKRNLSDFEETLRSINWELLSPEHQYQTAFILEQIRQSASHDVDSQAISLASTKPTVHSPEKSGSKLDIQQNRLSTVESALNALSIAVQDVSHREIVYREMVEQEARTDVERARSFLKKGEIHRGFTILRKIEENRIQKLADFPLDIQFDVYRLLGAVNLIKNNITLAKEYFDRAETISPNDMRLSPNWAQLHLMREEYIEAEQLGRKAVEANINVAQAAETTVRAMLAQKKKAEAQTWLATVSCTEDLEHLQICKAIVHLDSGDWEQARRFVADALRIAPDYGLANALMGDIILSQLYQKILKNASIEQARDLMDTRILESAISYHRKAIRVWDRSGIFNHSDSVRINLANTLKNLGRTKEGLREARQVVRRQPSNPETWVIAIQIAEADKEIGLAQEWCERAIQLFPSRPEPYFAISEIRFGQGDNSGALASLENAQKVCSDSLSKADLGLLRAQVYARLKDFSSVYASLDSIPEDFRRDPVVITLKANCYIQEGRLDDAEATLSNALQKYPKSAALLASMGRFFFFERRDSTRSIPYFQLWVEEAPSSTSFFYLIQALYFNEDYQQVASIAVQAREIRQITIPSQLFEAASLVNLRRYHEAIAVYEQIPAEKMDFASWCNLAVAQRLMGKHDLAIQAYESASRMKPSDPFLYLSLAELYLELDNRAKSFELARKALDLGQDQPEVHQGFFEMAFFSGHEREAVQVLTAIPNRFPDYIGVQTADIETYKQLALRKKEFSDRVLQFYRTGNLPFVAAATLLRIPTVELWHGFRKINYPHLIADGNIEEQRSELSALSCTRVVIDYTALITLQSLGMLDQLPKVFEKVFVPTHVKKAIISDRESLTRTQRDLMKRRKELREFVEQHPRFVRHVEWINPSDVLTPESISQLGPLLSQDVALARQLNAHLVCDDSAEINTCRGLIDRQLLGSLDLCDVVEKDGLLIPEAIGKARGYLTEAHGLRIASLDCSPSTDEESVVGWLSLELLWDAGLLQIILGRFKHVHISAATLAFLDNEIARGELVDSAHEMVVAIEDTLANSPIFELAASSIVRETKEKDDSPHLDLQVVEGLVLAQEYQIPLWTDDLATRRLAKGDYQGLMLIGSHAVAQKGLWDKVLSTDEHCQLIFTLLAQAYEFTSINAHVLYWTIKNHELQDNPDTQLVLKHLNDTATRVFNDITSIADEQAENGDHDTRLEFAYAAFESYWRVMSEFLTLLWIEIPNSLPHVRNYWADMILTSAMKAGFVTAYNLTLLLCGATVRILIEGTSDSLCQFLQYATTYAFCNGITNDLQRGIISLLKALDQINFSPNINSNLSLKFLGCLRGPCYLLAEKYIRQNHLEWLSPQEN